MDIWFYYDVTHALHRYCNPISAEGVRDLSGILELDPASRVLDVACGMGEMLIEFHERCGSAGVGVDVSPFAVERAEGRRARRVPEADIAFLNVRGEEFEPEGGERFDVAMCIGASWIWEGYSGTLDALTALAKPGGLIVSAEPYWIEKPDPEYLEADGCTEEQFFTLHGCLEIAMEKGLRLVWMRTSSKQEWDRYEMLQAAALDRFERENPDHPDLAEIKARCDPGREVYVKWGRETMGFAFWVFRTPGRQRGRETGG